MTEFKVTYHNPKRKNPTDAFINGLVPAKEFAEMLNEKGWLIAFKQIKTVERDYTHLIKKDWPHV